MKNALNAMSRLVLLLLVMLVSSACGTNISGQETATRTPIETASVVVSNNVASATADVYKDRADEYVETGYYELAFENYNKAIKLNPADTDTYFRRGYAHLFVKEYEEARADFRLADKLGYQDKGFLSYARGLTYLWESMPDSAIKEFNEAIQLSPDHTTGYQGRGQAYIAKGNYDEAIKDFNKVLQIDPNYAGGHVDRGIAYGHKGAYGLALDDFNRAFHLEKDDPYAYLGRGQVYAMMGETEQAKIDLNKALELSNDVRIQQLGKEQLAIINQK